eukprot:1737332-Prymnesium_polylepis.2
MRDHAGWARCSARGPPGAREWEWWCASLALRDHAGWARCSARGPPSESNNCDFYFCELRLLLL